MSPLQEIKLALIARKAIPAFEKDFKMKLSVNMAIQVLGTAAQVGDQIAPFLSPKAKDILAASIGILQAISALLGHLSTPDGQPLTLSAPEPPTK